MALWFVLLFCIIALPCVVDGFHIGCGLLRCSKIHLITPSKHHTQRCEMSPKNLQMGLTKREALANARVADAFRSTSTEMDALFKSMSDSLRLMKITYWGSMSVIILTTFLDMHLSKDKSSDTMSFKIAVGCFKCTLVSFFFLLTI